MRWNRERSIVKNHRNCLPLGMGVRRRHKPVHRLRNMLLKLNEWLLNVLNRLPPWSSLGEQFLQFLKNYLSWFDPIFLLFETRKSFVFQIFLLRSIKAYLCQNTIYFDCVDFSECRPEEVISFFWRSVYFRPPCHKISINLLRCQVQVWMCRLSMKYHKKAAAICIWSDNDLKSSIEEYD